VVKLAGTLPCPGVINLTHHGNFIKWFIGGEQQYFIRAPALDGQRSLMRKYAWGFHLRKPFILILIARPGEVVKRCLFAGMVGTSAGTAQK
jgi:hypothetical protein